MSMKAHIGRLKNARDVAKTITRELYAAGQLIEADAEKSITDGAVSGAGHIPSRPGDPPNEDTGALRRSIETRIVASADVPTVHVEAGGPSAPYAVYLENGTSKMAARPFMRPATEKNRAEVVSRVSAAVRLTIRSGG